MALYTTFLRASAAFGVCDCMLAADLLAAAFLALAGGLPLDVCTACTASEAGGGIDFCCWRLALARLLSSAGTRL